MNNLKRLKNVSTLFQLHHSIHYKLKYSTSTHSSSPPVDVTEIQDLWPRKIFSGIQPTGSIHIGNYLGAIRKWKDLQNSGEDVKLCIVDLHSITLPQKPEILRENILQLTATLLACGIDPKQSHLMIQSEVKQHAELNWILGCLTTMARLGHLPQYKEKTQKLKDIPLGLFTYPVLQSADILLYKATHVPVGEDQIQHIQLCQHLAKNFNYKFGKTFPLCHAIIDENRAGRILSLRDPTKKMSKSDSDPKSSIYLTDDSNQILDKIKKAITDFTSEVTYDPENRPGVSNLIGIHSIISGNTPSEICDNVKLLDTGKYKFEIADCLIEHIKPIRQKLLKYLANKDYLMSVLKDGNLRASEIAEKTLQEVKDKVGLGISVGRKRSREKMYNEL